MSIAAASPLWAIDARVGVTAVLEVRVSAPLLPGPAASLQTAFGLGFVSSVLDRIALTASAMRQDGHDREFLACAVGAGTVPTVKQ